MIASLKGISKIQERDTCLAMTFLSLLLWLWSGHPACIYAAMLLLLVGMIVPAAMRPLAALWFGLGKMLGRLTTPVLLTVVYGSVLVPVAFVRRLMGKDTLQLGLWKKGKDSCFIPREYVFTAEDFKNPY